MFIWSIRPRNFRAENLSQADLGFAEDIKHYQGQLDEAWVNDADTTEIEKKLSRLREKDVQLQAIKQHAQIVKSYDPSLHYATINKDLTTEWCDNTRRSRIMVHVGGSVEIIEPLEPFFSGQESWWKPATRYDKTRKKQDGSKTPTRKKSDGNKTSKKVSVSHSSNKSADV